MTGDGARTRPGILTPWGISSIVIVTALVAVAGVVTVTTLLRTNDTPTAAGSATTVADPGSICGLSGYDTDQDGLFQIENTTWTPTGPQLTKEGVPIRAAEMQLPSIDGAGPGTVADSGVRTCFARTHTGAVLAAANMLSASATPALAPELVEATTADGPGKQAAIDAAKNRHTRPYSDTFQIAGYQISSYDGDSAAVTIAMGQRSQLLAVPVALIWEDGDWKARLTPTGDQPVDARALSNLAGFTPWAAP